MRRIPELVEWGTNNIRKDSPQLLEKRVVEIRNVDGWEGVEDEAPFDAIHVGAAAATLPQPLVDQLRVRATTFSLFSVTLQLWHSVEIFYHTTRWIGLADVTDATAHHLSRADGSSSRWAGTTRNCCRWTSRPMARSSSSACWASATCPSCPASPNNK